MPHTHFQLLSNCSDEQLRSICERRRLPIPVRWEDCGEGRMRLLKTMVFHLEDHKRLSDSLADLDSGPLVALKHLVSDGTLPEAPVIEILRNLGLILPSGANWAVAERVADALEDFDAGALSFQTANGEERIASHTVVWAAGVAASPLVKTLALAPERYDRAGRVLVEPDLSVPGHPEIFVIGDLANISIGGKPVPGLAASAKQMGWCAAGNILKRLRGEPTQAFRYRDYGTLSPIGRNAAVAVLGNLKLSGFFAWLMWLFAHIYFLIGFRNRLIVMIDWATAYFSFQRNARIVAGGDEDRNLDGV